MLLLESFPEVARTWDISILATDISAPAIDYARTARYRKLEVNRGLPARMLLRHFTRIGEEWEITPAVRSLCTFQTHNLCHPFDAVPHADLILLRNVLLYVTPEDRRDILTRTCARLAPEGVLILGAAEQAEDSTALFHAHFAGECYFYRPVPAP
jgi:chemotaxis protein methyltransferase CheR